MRLFIWQGRRMIRKNEALAETYFTINTGLTQKVFDFFMKSSAKKFIFFSSVKAAAILWWGIS